MGTKMRLARHTRRQANARHPMWKQRMSGIAFDVSTLNPYRFSSEYADDALGLVYYNYRHYEPVMGRWMQRDFVSDVAWLNTHNSLSFLVTLSNWPGLFYNLYSAVFNQPVALKDIIGACVIIPDPLGLIEMQRTSFDHDWYKDLPNCPCSIQLDSSGIPIASPDGWTSVSEATHTGGSWEIRSVGTTATGSGQQCVYDSCGKLINVGPAAGTPDYVSPNVSYFRHIRYDGWQWVFGTEFDHETHPPNKGCDENGKPCPDNDGKDNPPRK